MTEFSYKHPPIVEAIIDITFSQVLNEKKLEALYQRFSKIYPNPNKTQVNNVEIQFGADGLVNQLPQKHEFEYSFSSYDQTQLAVIVKSHFLIAQRAPYKSWDDFISRFTENWKAFRKVVGYIAIERIGVRFINRLDIAIVNDMVEHQKYLNIYPNIPSSFGSIDQYAIQTQLSLHNIESILKINSAVVESPIPQHLSFIIDTDIIRVKNTPQDDEDIYSYLNMVRVEKNRVFEECITDLARKSFNDGR